MLSIIAHILTARLLQLSYKYDKSIKFPEAKAAAEVNNLPEKRKAAADLLRRGL